MRAPKRNTKPSTRTALHMKRRDGRRLNSCSPLLLTPGSESYDTLTLFTLRFPQRNSFTTSNRGSPTGTPSTYWRCIMKCSATTSRSRAYPSTLACLRMHKGKPAGRGEQFPMRHCYSLPVRQCPQVSNLLAPTMIGKSARKGTRPWRSGRRPKRRPMTKQG